MTRRFIFDNPAESGKYFVSARVNTAFTKCRNESAKTAKRTLYAELREQYPELPKEKNADEVDGFLEHWEAEHPDELKIEKVASFKGWTNVASGKLKQKTSYVLIKAVQDASEDIQESKSSQVRNLIDTVARQTIENSSEFQEFMAEANKRISEFTNPKNIPVLAEISSDLTRILSDYYNESEVIATWDPITQLQPPFPTAQIGVKDNEFLANLDGVGHGLQRAVILTVLRFIAERRASEGASGEVFAEPQSDLIIAIEEPEIYQHPTKQRLFGRLLPKLAEGFNEITGIRVQTIFITHSPLLVSIADCEGIRMVRNRTVNGKRNVCVNDISLERCSRRSAEVSGRKPEDAWSAAQYGAKLHTFNSEIAEGFFSKCVVLVEGVGDKAVLEAWYGLNGRDPYAEGIVIAEVAGKSKLSTPIVIFEELGIPCFWVFDSDKSSNKDAMVQSIKQNQILQRLGGFDEAQCCEWPEGVHSKFAVWDRNLEEYVSSIVGKQVFDQACIELGKHFDIASNMCLKFPATASGMLLKFREAGNNFTDLDDVISAVDKLMAAA